MTPDREMMPSPPSGLCACRLGNEYAHIAAISPRCVVVRLPEGKNPAGAMALQIYLPEEGRYETHTIEYKAEEAQRIKNAALFRLCFDDSACAGVIRKMMNAYARFLEIKSTLGASAWAETIAGYPADGDESFCTSPVQQWKSWFASCPALPQPDKHISLALELNCPELWELYLALPLEEFIKAYKQRRQIPEGMLPQRLPDRLYIGSGFCRHLFPKEPQLCAVCGKAEKEHLDITLTTAEPAIGAEAEADKIIAFARKRGYELMVNDWGFLQRAKGKCNLLLGPLLNKRRKDPRLAYKPGTDISLLERNSLHSDPWREYLASMGVKGWAWDHCGLPAELPPGINCLHLPFYQTNTSRWCPLRALCLHGNRGAQAPAESCGFLCEENMLLYPAHLKMIGRWNSIFALNDAFNEDELRQYDRWVLNF